MHRALRYGVVVVAALVGFRLAMSWLGTDHPGIGVFAVGAVVVVVAGVAGRWLAERRRQQLVAWAQQTGWTYSRRDPGLGLATVHSRPPFAQGRSRTVEDVLTGTYEGMRAVSFTYGWTTGSGDERREHEVHVVGVALPAYLPVLEVTPEGVGARLAKAFGARDLQLESAAFNAAYRVDAPDARTAHAILHPRTLERLLRPDALGLSWRIEGTWLLSWEGGATDAARIAPRLGVLAGIVRGVPRHVWQDHGHDPATTIAAHPESKESS
ncbi:hypothetical protein [Cellulomonas wangsupingiae]|uniref:DUF3137 domain-containing protein n=1 Tax=Cellulomonas wangsupingiae TaxID=2968085 RepID=A0ABY5K672_9CELL|nr:hypothetical protein [Cellulomonas wangsupingiae]MCC2336216.1 hypothetical protein [Cellulomonas wangsupingiae]UUI64540.1 hypothetical protein NP075_15685 [Cellulomonas wangsupingiae]